VREILTFTIYNMSTIELSAEQLADMDNYEGDTQNIEMTHGTTFDDAFSGTDMMDGFN
jgi:hypothetical protein